MTKRHVLGVALTLAWGATIALSACSDDDNPTTTTDAGSDATTTDSGGTDSGGNPDADSGPPECHKDFVLPPEAGFVKGNIKHGMHPAPTGGTFTPGTFYAYAQTTYVIPPDGGADGGDAGMIPPEGPSPAPAAKEVYLWKADGTFEANLAIEGSPINIKGSGTYTPPTATSFMSQITCPQTLPPLTAEFTSENGGDIVQLCSDDGATWTCTRYVKVGAAIPDGGTD